MLENKIDKDYVNEVVWKYYKAGSVTGMLVDILENRGICNRIYKICTDNGYDMKYFTVIIMEEVCLMMFGNIYLKDPQTSNN